MSASEQAQALRGAGHPEGEIPKLLPTSTATIVTYDARWKELVKALSALNVEALEAEVLWGSSVVETIAPLRSCVGRLKVALMRHARDLQNPEQVTWSEQRAQEIDQVIYEITDNPAEDKYLRTVQDAVEKIEAFLRPKFA